MKIKIELEPGAIMPTKAHEHDAGFDLYLHTIIAEKYWLPFIFDTGVHAAIPPGYVGLVLPRSSINARGIICPVGVIDSDYIGTIKVNLWDYEASQDMDYSINVSSYVLDFKPGDRIAQLVILPLPQVEFELGDVTGQETSRGDKGFGSSGEIREKAMIKPIHGMSYKGRLTTGFGGATGAFCNLFEKFFDRKCEEVTVKVNYFKVSELTPDEIDIAANGNEALEDYIHLCEVKDFVVIDGDYGFVDIYNRIQRNGHAYIDMSEMDIQGAEYGFIDFDLDIDFNTPIEKVEL